MSLHLDVKTLMLLMFQIMTCQEAVMENRKDQNQCREPAHPWNREGSKSNLSLRMPG